MSNDTNAERTVWTTPPVKSIDTLTNGAEDYVMKARLQQRLVPAVRRALAEAEEHQARKKAEEMPGKVENGHHEEKTED
jgi:hypothetical protein